MTKEQDSSVILGVSYCIRDSRGLMLDDSHGKTVDVKLGAEDILPGLSEALKGKAVGDKIEFFISGKEVYGIYRDDLVEQVNFSNLKSIENLQEGSMLEGLNEEGVTFPVMVTAIDNEFVTLDANHPLAGIDIYAEIEIVTISKK